MVLKIDSLEARHWVLARMVRGAELDPPREPLPHDDPQTVLAQLRRRPAGKELPAILRQGLHVEPEHPLLLQRAMRLRDLITHMRHDG